MTTDMMDDYAGLFVQSHEDAGKPPPADEPEGGLDVSVDVDDLVAEDRRLLIGAAVLVLAVALIIGRTPGGGK